MRKYTFRVQRHNQKSVELVINTYEEKNYAEILDWKVFSSPDDLREQAKEFLDVYNALVYYAEKLEGD